MKPAIDPLWLTHSDESKLTHLDTIIHEIKLALVIWEINLGYLCTVGTKRLEHRKTIRLWSLAFYIHSSTRKWAFVLMEITLIPVMFEITVCWGERNRSCRLVFPPWNQPSSPGSLPSTMGHFRHPLFHSFSCLYSPHTQPLQSSEGGTSPQRSVGLPCCLSWAVWPAPAWRVWPGVQTHFHRSHFLHCDSLRWVLVCFHWKTVRVQLLWKQKSGKRPQI